jgi:hypothetical protein
MIFILGILGLFLLVILLIERMNGCLLKNVDKYRIEFNGEILTGQVLILDVRSDAKKQRNKRQGALDGDVLVFFHGHGQLPRFGYEFSSLLAKKSSSGIVIIPQVYTPHGKDKTLRGDKGKLIILKKLVEASLSKLDITADFKEDDKAIKLSPFIFRRLEVDQFLHKPNLKTKLTLIGWSHGGLLARHFAHKYPKVVKNLAQITPAGYESWGQTNFAGLNLSFHFMIEVMFISTMVLRGQIKYPLIAGWAILRGVVGDSVSAFLYFFRAPLNPGRLFRAYMDIAHCSIVASDDNLPVQGLENIVVLYGEKDSVFEARNALPGVDLSQITLAEKRLFQKYYPSALEEGTRCSFNLLPGNHIGPLVYAQEYVTRVLEGTNQLAS